MQKSKISRKSEKFVSQKEKNPKKWKSENVENLNKWEIRKSRKSQKQ